MISKIRAIQAADARTEPEALAKLIEGEPDYSAHPTNGPRPDMDDMLNIIKEFRAPRGEAASGFTSEDFHQAMELNPEPWVMANASDDGLTAEFPFPGCLPPTALLTASNKAVHPRLGSGLLLRLRLPLDLRGVDVELLASQLNLAELAQPTPSHFMGAWCVDAEGNIDLSQQGLILADVSMPVDVMKKQANETLTYCSFLPSGIHQLGFLENIIYTMANRALSYQTPCLCGRAVFQPRLHRDIALSFPIPCDPTMPESCESEFLPLASELHRFCGNGAT